MPFLDPLTGFKGPTSNGRREEERDGKEIGKGRAGERGKGSPPPHSKFLDPPLKSRKTRF